MNSLVLRRWSPRSISSIRHFVNNVVDPSLVPSAREMEEGLIKQGATINPKVSVQLYDKLGLGLTATRHIAKFEPIAIVPRSLCVEGPSVDDLTVAVHRHLTTVDRSKLTGVWKFLKYLYNYANLVSPIMWGEKAEQQLVNVYYPEIEPDELLQQLAEKRSHLQRICDENGFKWDKFLLSVVLVESRCYELDEGSVNSQLLLSMIESPHVSDILEQLSMNYKGTVQQLAEKVRFDPALAESPASEVIVPFIDLMNHSFTKDNCYVFYNQTKREFHAVAAQDIPSGKQVMVDYGYHDDPTGLLMQYGIPPPMRNRGHNRTSAKVDSELSSLLTSAMKKNQEQQQQEEEGESGERPSSGEERSKKDTLDLVSFIAHYRQASGDRFIPM